MLRASFGDLFRQEVKPDVNNNKKKIKCIIQVDSNADKKYSSDVDDKISRVFAYDLRFS